MFEVYELGLAAAGQLGLAKPPRSKHAVTATSPQLKSKAKTTSLLVERFGLLLET